jgi:hypothetical protein
MVAGLVHVLSRGGTLADALQLATAAGTASALAPGTQLCSRAEVERLCAEVKVRPVRELAAARRGHGPAKARTGNVAETLAPA